MPIIKKRFAVLPWGIPLNKKILKEGDNFTVRRRHLNVEQIWDVEVTGRDQIKLTHTMPPQVNCDGEIGDKPLITIRNLEGREVNWYGPPYHLRPWKYIEK